MRNSNVTTTEEKARYSKVYTTCVCRSWLQPMLFGSLVDVNALHKAFTAKDLVVQVQSNLPK